MLEAQITQIAALNTQVAKQVETNQSQWEAISYISTQMPFALGWITPIPEGITLTPTPYSYIEYPPGFCTGNPEIDRVINAIQLSDIETRVELIRYIHFPCTTADGLGGPPKCEGDEPDGTVVTAFPVLFSEGTHVRPDEIQDVFDFSIRGLLAVYVVPKRAYQADYWPAGDYAVVFTSKDGGHAHTITLHVTDGEVVRLEFNMDWPPFDWIWDRSDTFILPRSTCPSPTPQLAICTLPACRFEEVHHCPDECPGGCGAICATVTPYEKAP
jgi:hypothetical protein